MRRRPTKRAFVIAGIGVLLILAGITAQAGWLFVLAAGVLGLVVGSFLVRHRLGGLTVERSVPRRVRVGDFVRGGLTVANFSARAVPLFTLDDSFAAFPPVRVGVERLNSGQTAEVEMVREATTRGLFSTGEVIATSGAPFGLTRSHRRLVVDSEVVVVPRWVDLATFPLAEPSSSSPDVVQPRQRAGSGGDFLGVREFRPGDPLRSVHWRSTARAGTLVVREFEQEISSRVVLVLTGAQHGEGPTSSFEVLVSACASVGIHALSTGHPILLVTASANGIDQLVDPSQNVLLDRLARVEPADVSLEGFVEVALDRLGGGGTVVMFTTSGGVAGASIDAAIEGVQSAGGRPVLVVARSSSWTGEQVEGKIAGSHVPMRVIENNRELGACLAG